MCKFLLVFLLLFNVTYGQQIHFLPVEIDSGYSFRGLSVIDDQVAWVAGNGFGISADGGKSWKFSKVKGYEKSDFRTIYAFNTKKAIISNAGSPAHILVTNDGGGTWKTVYTNNDPLAFFDGIDFWNESEGIIYGDPINGRLLLLNTSDGGETWSEIPFEQRPLVSAGEASFAASGTGIRCYGLQKIIIATGGFESRLFMSADRCKTWSEITVPITKGKSSTGIFSFDFNENGQGIVVGGDYLADSLKVQHVYYSSDRGSHWKYPLVPTGGYRECVEFLNDTMAIAAGPGGIDITYDAGINWVPVSNERQFHVIRQARKGSAVIAAGKGKISVVFCHGLH